VERLGMLCNAQHARKLSTLYACSLHFSETDFTLGDENKYGQIGSSKYFYGGLTVQFSPPSIIVIMPFNMKCVIWK
jgi:hypothetical protein